MGVNPVDSAAIQVVELAPPDRSLLTVVFESSLQNRLLLREWLAYDPSL